MEGSPSRRSLPWLRKSFYRWRPPPPGRLRGLLPPPQGGGQCLAIAPDSRARGGNRIFGGFSPTLWLTLCRARHLWRIAPPGEGLTGRGERPFPCLLHLTLNGFRWNTPTARRATAASSRPLQGGGQLIGDWPGYRVRGDGSRISAGCSHQAVEMLFPGSASMGYRPVGRG